MVEKRERLDREERLLRGAKSKNRPRDQDPRQAAYARLVKRTAQKYKDIASKRGIAVKPEKDT
jgi:hypothetical protein